MLRFVDDEFSREARGGVHLLTAFEVNEGEWICHSDNYIVAFRYKNGRLAMAMGDTYYDIEYGNEAKLIAQDPELIAKSFFKSKKKVDPEPIKFKDILDLMEWTCDDYIP